MFYKYGDLNVDFVSAKKNKELKNGCILQCGNWDANQIKEWAPNLHYYTIIYIRDNWLNNPQACAEGLSVKITW